MTLPSQSQAWLPDADFAAVVRHAPLISIDLLVRSPDGAVLLGQRLRRPAQGSWFVPGGRVRKGESVAAAFRRLCLDELGQEQAFEQAIFRGVYEHHYADNVFGDDFTTHYVVLAYELVLAPVLTTLPCEQHDAYRWWQPDELLADASVHLHTRWYFQSDFAPPGQSLAGKSQPFPQRSLP